MAAIRTSRIPSHPLAIAQTVKNGPSSRRIAIGATDSVRFSGITDKERHPESWVSKAMAICLAGVVLAFFHHKIRENDEKWDRKDREAQEQLEAEQQEFGWPAILPQASASAPMGGKAAATENADPLRQDDFRVELLPPIPIDDPK